MKKIIALLIPILIPAVQLIAQTIQYEPQVNIKVDDIIFFRVDGITGNQGTITYDWDFGDEWTTGDGNGGTAYTHRYPLPGDYTVTLRQNGVVVDAVTITVNNVNRKLPPFTSDSPVLELNFENNLNDDSGNGYNADWGSNTGSFVQGVSGQALDLSSGNYAVIDAFSGLNGKSEFTLSFWAKRPQLDNSDYLYFAYCNNKFNTYLRHESQAFFGAATSETGVSRCETWYYSNNTTWHHYALVYDGEYVKLYIDGLEELQNYNGAQALTGNLTADVENLFIGSDANGENLFDGYIDEFKIYDSALTLNEVYVGFELWHANFHGRTGQYIYAQVPGAATVNAANRISAAITGDNGYNEILLDKNDLQSEEKILLRNRLLPAGNYTLNVRLLNSDNTVIDEITKEFNKPYDGIPEVGIDENNAIRLKDSDYPEGKLFYQVTSCGLNNADVLNWEDSEYINTLQYQGYYPNDNYTVSGWEDYINISNNLRTIGPGAWEGRGEGREQWQNADLTQMENYVNAAKNHPATLMWQWADEPDLRCDNGNYVSPAVIKAWSYLVNKNDPQHLSSIGLAGAGLANGEGSFYEYALDYTFLHNSSEFGINLSPSNGVNVADVYDFDYYPLDWASPHSRGATMEKLANGIDNYIAGTRNLVPIRSWVETPNIWEYDPGTQLRDPTPWHPGPEQLKMMTWLNVVHGVKGICWFHWHRHTPDENLEIMKEFTSQITELTPIVLGPESEISSSVRVVNDAGRVDYMIREYGDTTYIFAVRLSEVEASAGLYGYPDPVQNYSVSATFTVEGLTNNSITVYNEDRTILTRNGEITDAFMPYEVHIYKFQKDVTDTDEFDFILYQNHPNPFNYYTYIDYDIPTDSDVKLMVHDVRGRMIFEKIYKNRLAGRNSILFDSRNLSSGTYIYTMEVNGQSQTKKMVLHK